MDDLIMIVDDSSITRAILKEILTNNGYELVIEASDGDEACRLFEKARPHVVFMDLILNEKSGLDVIAHIKSVEPKTKFIICSAMSQNSIVAETKALGAVEYIKKPITPDKVMSAVKMAFAKKS